MLEIKAHCYELKFSPTDPEVVQVWRHELVQWGDMLSFLDELGLKRAHQKSDIGIVSTLWATMCGDLRSVRLDVQRVLKRQLKPMCNETNEGLWVEV